MPLFQIIDKKATFLKPTNFATERQLQHLVEGSLQTIFEARFIATEFIVNVDGVQNGRIDSLALDKENTPIIIEYKKTNSESVINQALFYLEWLVTHKGDFEIAVQKKLGKDSTVNWENPRVLVVAERFSPWDLYGVRRMGANIELWTYRYYNNEFLMLEAVYVPGNGKKIGKYVPLPEITIGPTVIEPVALEGGELTIETKPIYDLESHLIGKSEHIRELFDSLRERIMELQSADGVIVEVFLKMYIGYKRGKNFCEIHIYQNDMVIWLDIPYADLKDPLKLGKDASLKGHWGTGDVEVRLSEPAKLDSVVDLIRQAYEYVG